MSTNTGNLKVSCGFPYRLQQGDAILKDMTATYTDAELAKVLEAVRASTAATRRRHPIRTRQGAHS
jgi:hypothetical protein